MANRKSVEELKEKARKKSSEISGKTSESILYGPENDVERAQGAGEFDQ